MSWNNDKLAFFVSTHLNPVLEEGELKSSYNDYLLTRVKEMWIELSIERNLSHRALFVITKASPFPPYFSQGHRDVVDVLDQDLMRRYLDGSTLCHKLLLCLET